MPAELTDEQKALIELIEWYRDEYHRCKLGTHNDLIRRTREAESEDDIEQIWHVVDSWLDH